MRKFLYIVSAIIMALMVFSCGTSKKATQVVPESKDEVEVVVPLKNISDTKDSWVVFSKAESHDLTQAKLIAENDCRGQLALKVSSRVRAAVETYRGQTGASSLGGMNMDYEQISENYVRTVARETLNGASVTEYRIFRNKKNGHYIYWASMSMPKKSATEEAVNPNTLRELDGYTRAAIEQHRNEFISRIENEE